MLAAGALAVLLYRRRYPSASLTPGTGARLGALSGILGSAMFAIFAALEMAVSRTGGQLRATLLEAVQQSASRSSDPQAQELLQWFKTPQGLTLIMVLGLIVMFVVFLIFSSLGGALGAVLLRKKDQR